MIAFMPSVVWGETVKADSSPYSFWDYVLFWSGGVFLVYFMGRKMFREHIGERRTLRRLIDEIGPVYPDFDIDGVKKWVHLCAPHVWEGWGRGVIETIDDFVTDEFQAHSRAELGALKTQGLRRSVHLESVIKVHPVDLSMVGEGPPPVDVQLTLRLELKAKDAVINAEDQLISGSLKSRQVQYFWRIRHDGQRWRLHEVWPAETDYVRAENTIDVPPILEWRRPDFDSGEPSP